VLFVEPRRLATDEPLIDELTMSMTGALRRATVPCYRFLGVHVCIRGAVSDSTNRILPNGEVTNTLCVHYLAYHRAEVPPTELDEVRRLPARAQMPSPAELGAPGHRFEPKRLIWRLDAERYELLLDNRAKVAVQVTEASFARSLDGAHSDADTVEAGWALAPGEVRPVPHAPTFRVADFRHGRRRTPPRRLSVASTKGVTCGPLCGRKSPALLFDAAICRPTRPVAPLQSLPSGGSFDVDSDCW
jgi:hypothetical protein